MGAKSSITAAAGKYVAPRLPALAPELNATFVREALHRAIHGIGPLPSAAAAAEQGAARGQGSREARRPGGRSTTTSATPAPRAC